MLMSCCVVSFVTVDVDALMHSFFGVMDESKLRGGVGNQAGRFGR